VTWVSGYACLDAADIALRQHEPVERDVPRPAERNLVRGLCHVRFSMADRREPFSRLFSPPQRPEPLSYSQHGPRLAGLGQGQFVLLSTARREPQQPWQAVLGKQVIPQLWMQIEDRLASSPNMERRRKVKKNPVGVELYRSMICNDRGSG
jgi:hypothetical protein